MVPLHIEQQLGGLRSDAQEYIRSAPTLAELFQRTSSYSLPNLHPVFSPRPVRRILSLSLRTHFLQ